MAKKSGTSFQELLAELKKKQYRPVYFLAGEEPFYIDQVSDYIEEHALSPEEKEFNQQILYGKETDIETVINEAMRYPMMSERVVVVVREAQNLRSFDLLESYIKNPSPTTVLVFCHKYKKVDKRKTFGKSLAAKGFLFESDKLYDNQLPDWVMQHATQRGFKLGPRAANMLVELLGNDLSRLSNEITRLTLNLQPGSEITDKLVSEYTGISREYNNFELVSALAVKDARKANMIISYFGQNPNQNPMVVTLGIVFNYYSKLLQYHEVAGKHPRNEVASLIGVNPFFLKEYETGAKNYGPGKALQVISLLREYDLRSKGVDNAGTPHSELLREMIFRILH